MGEPKSKGARVTLRKAEEESKSKCPRVTLRKAEDSRNPPLPPPAPVQLPNGSPNSAFRRTDVPTNGTDKGLRVTFDVCGQLFKVPMSSIQCKPGTLLAELLESRPVGDEKVPIFVDSDASRFPLILDWYRHDEIHVPSSMAMDAVLTDARYYKLPDEIVVNGALRSTQRPSGQEAAQYLIETVVRNWGGFPAYLRAILEKIRQHYKNVGATSTSGLPEDEAYDFSSFRLPVYNEEKGWVDTRNVCSAARARVLAMKLEDHGYHCSFSDAELVVGLPLQLQGELLSQDAPADAQEEVEEGEAPAVVLVPAKSK